MGGCGGEEELKWRDNWWCFGGFLGVEVGGRWK